MNILLEKPVNEAARISMEFDIFRYVLISLTYLGHKLVTNFSEGRGLKGGVTPSSFRLGINKTRVLY